MGVKNAQNRRLPLKSWFRGFLLLFLAIPGWPAKAAVEQTQKPPPLDRRVVLVVWDGMRPDFVTRSKVPALWKLSQEGVTFLNHHSVYLSATEVNGTAINTGGYPANDGIVANSEYRPAIDPLRAFHTETLASDRKGDRITGGHVLKMPTIAEIVRAAGKRTAVAAAKPVGLLPDRSERATSDRGANVFAGATLPKSLESELTNELGVFPKDTATTRTRNDWTTRALVEHLWATDVPAFSLLWLNQPDFSQHSFGPGSKQALEAMRNADENLQRVMDALEKKGLRKSTDIIVVSDHGFSTMAKSCDLAAALVEGGFKAFREFKKQPEQDEILVTSNSGSSLLYVIGHQPETVRELVALLQVWECSGVIFTRDALPGTFPLSQVHLDSTEAPDMVLSFRWNNETNANGVAGMLFADKSGFNTGQGLHCSLSPYDMHATLIAAGPDFRSNERSTIPTGNVDIAPTILHVLGLSSWTKMDGRVITEALAGSAPNVPRSETRRIESSATNGPVVWHQYLKISKVGVVDYFDEGNGSPSER
jgi:arylsulfatase A-like enzyme